jgi:hypothetical protein
MSAMLFMFEVFAPLDGGLVVRIGIVEHFLVSLIVKAQAMIVSRARSTPIAILGIVIVTEEVMRR